MNGRAKIGLGVAVVLVVILLCHTWQANRAAVEDRRRLNDILSTLPRLSAEASNLELEYGAINHPAVMTFRSRQIAPLSQEVRRIADRHPDWPDVIAYRTPTR